MTKPLNELAMEEFLELVRYHAQRMEEIHREFSRTEFTLVDGSPPEALETPVDTPTKEN